VQQPEVRLELMVDAERPSARWLLAAAPEGALVAAQAWLKAVR